MSVKGMVLLFRITQWITRSSLCVHLPSSLEYAFLHLVPKQSSWVDFVETSGKQSELTWNMRYSLDKHSYKPKKASSPSGDWCGIGYGWLMTFLSLQCTKWWLCSTSFDNEICEVISHNYSRRALECWNGCRLEFATESCRKVSSFWYALLVTDSQRGLVHLL